MEIDAGLLDRRQVQEYHRLTWTDDGTVITFTAEAVACWGDTPGVVRTLSRTYPPG